MDAMVLIGSLRLIAGLTFLGVVIALGLWLLSRLFPGTANTSHISQNNTASAAFQAQQTTVVGESRQQHKTPGVVQEQGPQNDDDQDERKQ
jgi:hypothetical protein